jgi:hypothetical protein
MEYRQQVQRMPESYLVTLSGSKNARLGPVDRKFSDRTVPCECYTLRIPDRTNLDPKRRAASAVKTSDSQQYLRA